MRRTMRLGAYVASAALTISGLSALTSPATADQAQASAAADWLAGQLDSGLLPGPFGGGDVGVSIDAGFALAAIGGHGEAVGAIADAVQGPKGSDYVEYTYSFDSDGDGTAEEYAGQAANATAKALAYLQALPTPRSTIGDLDLVERLEALTVDSGAEAGRIKDVSTKDGVADGQDYANTLGQAFAARALQDAGSAEAGAALSFLLKQQCPSGGFRTTMSATACTDDADSSADSTSIAVAQVATMPLSDELSEAIHQARTWLAGQQDDNGAFGGGVGTSGANSNSTGLAAVALGSGAAAEAAAAWLGDRQVPADQQGSLADDAGAIAYDDAAYAAATSTGIQSSSRDQWQRATAQAAAGLLVVDGAERSLSLTGPAGYLRAGSVATLTGAGLEPGRTVRLSGPGTDRYRTADAASWSQSVTLPGSSTTARYTLTEDTGLTATRAVKVLGAKTFRITKTKSRVRRSGKVTVTMTGLAPGERAAILFKGDVKKRGVATDGGRFSATFRVGRVTGVKKVVGLGQFADIRRGTTTIRVVR